MQRLLMLRFMLHSGGSEKSNQAGEPDVIVWCLPAPGVIGGLKHHRLEAGGFDRRLKARLFLNQRNCETHDFPRLWLRPTTSHGLPDARLGPTYWKLSPEGEGF
jgi:hypothetical protein